MLFPVGILYLRIEVSNLLKRSLLHPCAVIAHILGESACARPVVLRELVPLCLWIHRRLTRELRRDLDHRLVDHDGDRIEVMRVRLKPKPLCLQWNRPTARKGVKQRRWIPVRGRQDLRFRSIQNALIIGVLPFHELLEYAKEASPLLLLRLLRGELLWMCRWIIDERRPDHGTRRRRWLTRPPQMER